MRCRLKNYKLHTILKQSLIFLLILTVSGSHPGLFAADPVKKKWVVVIDAGHGGRDPGAIGRRAKEKDITLAIALKTGKYIKDLIEDVDVIYTRNQDEFIEIYKRAEIANKANADLFISIHCNGFGDSRIKGSETYVMGLHKDQGNLEVAMKENSVVALEEDYSTRYQGYDPNSSESYIIFSLMQNIFLTQSLDFANYIQDQFRTRVGRGDRGVKQAGFIVLWQTTMPSVLVETGYITNSDEEKFLMSVKGQDYIASAIFRAFRDYKAFLDTHSDFSTVNSDGNKWNNDIKFMVQLVTSSARRDTIPENFNGVRDIREIVSGKYYKYAAGSFTNYEEAASHRTMLKQKYPDAFVISVRNGKTIPLQEAIELSRQKK